MSLTPERLYFELGRLVAQTPALVADPITPQVQRWLATAIDLVNASGNLAESVQLTVACQNLSGPLRARNADTITNILLRVLSQAERNTPHELRGSVLLIREGFDAYTAMRQLLGTATQDVLLVEPDAAGKVLADYAILAPERVGVRLLADEAHYKASLSAGLQRWQRRFGGHRNLTARLAWPNTLHERLILLDGERAWVLGVPFAELAKRTHTTLVRMTPEEEARKVRVYAEIWDQAQPLVRSA